MVLVAKTKAMSWTGMGLNTVTGNIHEDGLQ